MSTLKQFQQIDDLTKIKISGYIREYEKNNQNMTVIPMMIQYIIMMYYWINEKFNKHGKSLQIDKNSKIVSVKYNPIDKWFKYNTVYGDIIINDDDESIAKYKWSIKYSFNKNVIRYDIGGDIQILNNNNLIIGIASDENSADRKLSRNCIQYSNGIIEIMNDPTDDVARDKSYIYGSPPNPMTYTGMIHLSLDMKQLKLSFTLDKDPKEYNIDGNIDMDHFKYRLAISVNLRQGNKFELFDFQTFHKSKKNVKL